MLLHGMRDISKHEVIHNKRNKTSRLLWTASICYILLCNQYNLFKFNVKKNIILIYFWIKNILKNNHNHTSKHLKRNINNVTLTFLHLKINLSIMCNFLVLPTPVSPYGIELNSLLQGKTNYKYIYIILEELIE
jgi:low temperature requirement protein LtrA